MIYYKTPEEIELLRASNMLVARTHGEVSKLIKPGVTTLELDKVAREFIRDNGAEPGFLNYGGFPYSLCISVNDTVVHGFPSKYELKDGDVVSVDCGAVLNGYNGDSAFTYMVGNVDPKVKALLKVTKEALYLGIEQAVVGARIGDIGYAVQKHCESHGYSIVREMVGHGVGRNLHEDPQVPNYGRRGRGIKLQEGLVIAIEPMVNIGKRDIYQLDDGWTIKTVDGGVSAHFEHTVAVVNGKADILSSFEFIEK